MLRGRGSVCVSNRPSHTVPSARTVPKGGEVELFLVNYRVKAQNCSLYTVFMSVLLRRLSDFFLGHR